MVHSCWGRGGAEKARLVSFYTVCDKSKLWEQGGLITRVQEEDESLFPGLPTVRF